MTLERQNDPNTFPGWRYKLTITTSTYQFDLYGFLGLHVAAVFEHAGGHLFGGGGRAARLRQTVTRAQHPQQAVHLSIVVFCAGQRAGARAVVGCRRNLFVGGGNKNDLAKITVQITLRRTRVRLKGEKDRDRGNASTSKRWTNDETMPPRRLFILLFVFIVRERFGRLPPVLRRLRTGTRPGIGNADNNILLREAAYCACGVRRSRRRPPSRWSLQSAGRGPSN